MSPVWRNTVANYAGQVWVALMSIAFVPTYIRVMGVEAYGIVGFFVVVQSFFTILDMGLSATLTRELARRSVSPAAAAQSRSLVRTLEWICWPVALVIAIVMWGASGPIASGWLNANAIPVDRVGYALILLGMSFALQWPVSFYSGGLSGLQRQVDLNVMAAGFATVRGAGAVLILTHVSPTIEAFLYWQIAISGLQTATYAGMLWRRLPAATVPVHADMAQLKSVGAFAAGVTGTTIITFMLTQADRIILSRALALDAFGIYAFASSVAVIMLRVAQPICSAVYPRYSQLIESEDWVALTAFYHRTNQMMAVTIVPATVVAALFSTDVLFLWTGDRTLAAEAGPIAAILFVGMALNGLMNLPYALQLASGWTKLGLFINLVALFVALPVMWLLANRMGGTGVALAWLLLNFGYIAIGVPMMHRRLLRGEMQGWLLKDMIPSIAASLAVGTIWRFVVSGFDRSLTGIAWLALISLTTLMAAVLSTAYPRGMLLKYALVRRHRAL